MTNYYRFAFIICVAALTIVMGISLKKYFYKSWVPYYQEKLNQEPRPLLIKVLGSFKDDDSRIKRAFDLGAGAGNDTALLLKRGWYVWANDKEEAAIEIISSRADIELYRNKLVLIHKSFSDIPWADFQPFDLMYAGYSLPFAHPTEFMNIWHHIVQALSSGGLFAGHFFGSDEGRFNWWIKRSMTFLTKAQVLELFQEFKIEDFKEFYEKNSQGIIEHSFDVIARKL